MRKINEICIHCSATPEGRHVTVATIRKWHKARRWKDIGYHFVIYLDGSVHKGRPVEQTGAHVAGRNKNTIGVCYVGGVEKDGKTPKDTRTPAQKSALLILLKQLLRDHPGIKVISGHHDYAAKACPCFPARKEYAHLLKPKPDRLTEYEKARDPDRENAEQGPIAPAERDKPKSGSKTPEKEDAIPAPSMRQVKKPGIFILIAAIVAAIYAIGSSD